MTTVRTKLHVAALTMILVAALTTGIASAHVTANPREAEAGGFAKIAFRVPNERPESTTSISVKMPEDHPIGHVSVRPVPGWTADVQMRTLDEPINVFGEEVSEVVDTITWTGSTINAGEFQEFEVSMGPLPEGVDVLYFPTIQLYEGGEEVAWIEEAVPGEEEPERPAPAVTLSAAAEEPTDGEPAEEPTGTTAAPSDEEPTGGEVAQGDVASNAATTAALNVLQDDVDEVQQYSYAGIAVGLVALIVAIMGVLAARKES